MNQKLTKNSPEKENTKSVWNNSLVIFFFAPIMFFFWQNLQDIKYFTEKQVKRIKALSKFYLLQPEVYFTWLCW